MQVPNCVHAQQANMICIQKGCTKPNPFISKGCSQGNCQCQHNQCFTMEWSNFCKKMESSKLVNDSRFKTICENIENAIFKIQKLINKQIENFNVWKSTFGMPKTLVEFYESIQNKKQSEWTGNQIHAIKVQVQSDENNARINEMGRDNHIDRVFLKAQQLQHLVRKLYVPLQKKSNIYEITTRIKQRDLKRLTGRLETLKQRPQHLELKYVKNS